MTWAARALGPLSAALLALACKRGSHEASHEAPHAARVAPGEAGEAGAAITTAAAPGHAQPPSGLSPGDFGVPIYPGAASDPDGLQRIEMGAYYQIHASFETGALPDTVAAYYRAKLKVLAREPGALVETLDPEKTTFALKRDAGHMTFVAIEPREGKPGSDIQLSATGTISTSVLSR